MLETQSGYLCLGPTQSQHGDEIWLLKNARVPFLLRKLDACHSGEPTYVLLGEVYVHGFMRGEMVTDELTAGIGKVTIV